MKTKKIPGYQILLDREIGKGSYGTVYVAEKQSTKEMCAIKIINKSKILKSSYLERALFLEIKIMAKMSSQNVVNFIGVLQSANNYYIAQELCDTDLEKQLKSNIFSQGKAISILTQICHGFIELNKYGVVHRDIKPSNIIMKKGVPKIADFGFAKENLHKGMKNQSNVGTPLYKPIEIFKGIPYTSKCDIWSIGIIFYQMIHGKTPFDLLKIKCQEDLVSQIEKKQFYFDSKLSPQSRNFLEQVLQVYEKDRISWNLLYQHPIFKGKFEKYLDQDRKLQAKYRNLMGNIRIMVNLENIDVKKVWIQLGFKTQQSLGQAEFQLFLNKIKLGIDRQQLLYIIEQIDSKGNGKISLEQFQQELNKIQFIDLPLGDSTDLNNIQK